MPLILAIEPDRRQASQLTALVRGRLHADLVLGESADRALTALGDRVPDLILTAALLSPKDEAALDQRLRELNGVAAHVQTLTIPVLASGKKHGHGLRTGGLLSALRRDKPKSAAPDGCDPAVFAEQCKEYLERAANEQELLAEHADHAGHDAADAPATILTGAESTDFLEPAVAAFADDDLAIVVDSALDEVRDAFAHAVLPAEPVTPEPRARRRLDPLDADGPASLVAALALFEAEEEAARDEPAPAQPIVEDTIDAMELSALLDPAHGEHRGADAREDVEPSVEVYDIDEELLQSSDLVFEEESRSTLSETELYMPLPRGVAAAWPTLEVSASHAPAIDVAADEGVPAQDAGEQDDPEPLQEWMDIIEALRRDAAPMPMRGSRTEIHAGSPIETSHAENSAAAILGERHSRVEVTPPSPAGPSDPDPLQKRKRRRRDSPAQDEWGFFDPDQCGFAALLEKLQEITEQDEAHAPRV